MKLVDIQSALLADKETTFTLKCERFGTRFVIESIETKEESYDDGWKKKTRSVNYAVGTVYWFYASQSAEETYDNTPRPARFVDSRKRVRISQVEPISWEETLTSWKEAHLRRDADRVANALEQDSADKHLAQVLTEALGVEVALRDAQSVSSTLRDLLLNHFSSVNA